jgi:hypothetical protein
LTEMPTANLPQMMYQTNTCMKNVIKIIYKFSFMFCPQQRYM